MLATTLMTVVLWVVAVTATIWIVVPAMAFALRLGGGVRTDVVDAVGPPPVAGREHAFEQQWRDLEALGFRAAARTVQHGWFIMPTFWHWRQCATRARAATTADIAAASDAAEAETLRAMAKGGYFLFWIFSPAVLFLPLLRHDQGRGSAQVALGICAMAGISASLRWLIHGPLARQAARASHDPRQAEVQAAADVDADGTILATGKYERWLRVLATMTSCLTGVWALAFVWALSRSQGRHGLGGALVQAVLFAVFGGSSMVEQVARARGRVPKRASEPTDVWTSLMLFNFILACQLEWSQGTLHHVLYGVAALSILLALVGGPLEKKRGQ